jgi:hypothetical protein
MVSAESSIEVKSYNRVCATQYFRNLSGFPAGSAADFAISFLDGLLTGGNKANHHSEPNFAVKPA